MRILATVLLLALAGLAARAAEPAIPPMAGVSAEQARERADLFAALKAAKTEPDARAVEERIRAFWRGLADAQSRKLMEEARAAQLRFDYDEALFYLKAAVQHQPQFADGWNELGYNYFLAGRYDESLDAIAHVLALEPMHYAALAGRGIILWLQGKETEMQAPLSRALAINPWLKERNLIKDPTLLP